MVTVHLVVAPVRGVEKLPDSRIKGFSQPAPSLLSLPGGEKIKERSQFLCRVLRAFNRSYFLNTLLGFLPDRGLGAVHVVEFCVIDRKVALRGIDNWKIVVST